MSRLTLTEWEQVVEEARDEERSFCRIWFGRGDRFHIIETNESCDYEWDADKRLTHTKFDSEEEAGCFARRTYLHPSCPAHIKNALEPLIKELDMQDVNVDSWMGEDVA